MNESSYWPAPAKLNLFLHITGRRPDGYHLLQTVFQFLDVGDELAFTVTDNARITRVGAVPGVAEEVDLIVRAARLLQRVGKVTQGAVIHIKKRLPLGGGLGGGSSDAATTLVALNRLWGLDFGADRLAELGLQLGADVPVFVRGFAAWGEGVGEQLTPVDLPETWFLVIVPPCQVSTIDVFSHPDLTRDATPITIRNFLSGAGKNVCEPVVKRLYPEVAEAMDWLEGFGAARMSGTGASVFASFAEEARARSVLAELPSNWRGFVARGRNRSPLTDRLEV